MTAPSAALVVDTPFANAGTSAAVLVAENVASVHDPIDIALCGFSTRSMLRNRLGRPRSVISRAADAGPPAAATHLASRARVSCVPAHSATLAMTAAPPAAPPTKKYSGTSQVHTGAFSS